MRSKASSRRRGGLPARARLPMVVLLLSLGVGLFLIFFHAPLLTEQAHNLGEALLIASLLGLTVDRYLKFVLVREVGNLAMQAIFGANAPQEYGERLADNLRSVGAISISSIYSLDIAWDSEERDVLAVTSEVRIEYLNISTKPWPVVDPRIASSRAPNRVSRFTDYEITIRNPQAGQRAGVISSQHYASSTDPQMSTAQHRNDDGTVVLNRSELGGFEPTVIAPGATASLRIQGTTYHPSRGGLPIVTRTPSLEITLKLRGEALSDLTVQPYIGAEVAETSDNVFMFGFTHAQSTLRVEWEPLESQRTARENIPQN
jgi:hypothetical protein